MSRCNCSECQQHHWESKLIVCMTIAWLALLSLVAR